MKIIKGGITKPKGFKASGISCGIKSKGKLDLGLIVSDEPCLTAAVFTENSVKAAPLLISKKHLKNNKAQAIIVNSGNANCMTGNQGLEDAKQMANAIANRMKVSVSDVLVTSTGIIGKPLPINKIICAVSNLISSLSFSGSSKFEKAILTTDLVTKSKTVEVMIKGKKVIIGGVAKGSGMIAPNMATMLGFITTDVAISSVLFRKALNQAVGGTFNSISVDGCMSTNDMVVAMASGLAGNVCIKNLNSKEFQIFILASRM